MNVQARDAGTKPGWWKRNWPWALPCGCVTVALLFAAFVGAIMLIVLTAIKSSDAYGGAVEKARAHPRVQAALGTPIEEGYLLQGNINVSGPSGNANLSIPLSGPKGAGTLHVQATKSAGQWTFNQLLLDVHADGSRINLHQQLPGDGGADGDE